MKILTILISALSLTFSEASIGDDNISVTVNGTTYVCSRGSSGSGNKCLCYEYSTRGNWRAKFFKNNSWFNATHDLNSKEECEVAARSIPDCN